MKRQRVVLAVLITALVVGCGVQRTPIQQAEYIYVGVSIDYEAAQKVIVAARAQGLVSDATWTRFDRVQHTIADNAPLVRGLLDVWKATGVKPTDLDSKLATLADARDTAVAIQAEVKR